MTLLIIIIKLFFLLQCSSHVLIFNPSILTVAVDHNASTIIRLISESDQLVHVTFVYGENRSLTTDLIRPLPSVTFNENLPKTQIVLQIIGRKPGHLIVGCDATPVIDSNRTERDFLRLNIARSLNLERFIYLVGWLYFAAWSCSFYPQIILNFQRKSVVGLNFDFLALNFVGFFCYSIYNIALYSWRNVQDEYEKLYPRSVIPVLINDVVFGLHGFIATFVTIYQCLIFERSNQRVSNFTSLLIILIVLFLILTTILTSIGSINLLNSIYFYSYVKLFVSSIKYFPQVLMNYRRKSTEGWSIGNILLDFTGGILSFSQMILLAINYNDFASIFSSITKLGLAFLSMGFDLIFILQHFKFYRTIRRSSSNRGYRVLDDQDDSTAEHL